MTRSTLRRTRLRNKLAASLVLFFSTALCALAGASAEHHVSPEHHYVTLPSRPLTLKDCISLALDESPALEASRLDVTSAAEEARAARGELLPSITGRGTYQLFS